MLKPVFREIIIILLLILAIILLLGIMFYDYMPTSKIIPQKVEEYALDEDIKLELQEELNNVNKEEIVKTYMLDAIDLEGYEKTKEYNKGKPNPFAASVLSNTQNTTSSGTTTNSSASTESNTSNNNSNTQNNTTNTNPNTSTGTFLNTVGK